MSERSPLRKWESDGLTCAVIDSGIGFLNGYVQLPADHVARTATYDQINRSVSAHGGLTYGVDADGWVGFDTGHSGDVWPGLESKYTRDHLGNVEWRREWDMDSLAAEVESVAAQLAAMTVIAAPESSWDCTDAEFRVLLRQAKAWRRIRAVSR